MFVERRVSFATEERNTMTQTEFKPCDCQDEILQTDTDENKPKLQIQKMPVVDIRGGMRLQTLKPIEIPSEPIPINPKNDNVHYEEIKAVGSVEIDEAPYVNKTSQTDDTTSVQNAKLLTEQLATQTESDQRQKATQTDDSLSVCPSTIPSKLHLTSNLKKKLSECFPNFTEEKNGERDKMYTSFQLYSETDHEPEPLEKTPHSKGRNIEEQVYKTFINPKGFQSDDSVLLYDNSDHERRLSEDKERTPSHIIDNVIQNALTDYETDDDMKVQSQTNSPLSVDDATPLKTTRDSFIDLHENQILSVLDEVIEMKANTSDSSESRKLSVVKLGETRVFPIESATQYSIGSCSASGSSYEVIDAATQISTSLSSDNASTKSPHPDESGDLRDSFTTEWKKVVRKRPEDNITPSKHKVMVNQSPQDMIDILKKVVKEGTVKAQESVKEFYQPTKEELMSIRKGSQHFSKVKP